jgi:two-component system LytT family response regulator
LKALVIEDNDGALKALKRDLKEFCPNIDVVDSSSSVEGAIALIDSNTSIQLLFLDVELEGGTCFDILKRINYKQYKIIFITAFSEYAIKAFRYSAIDYLMKPIKEEELIEAVNRVEVIDDSQIEKQKIELLLENLSSSDKYTKIALTNSDGTYIVNIEELVYIEANGNYTKVYLKNEKKSLLISKTLKFFEKLLQNLGFIRPHHAYIVNSTFIRKYVNKDGSYLILKDGTHVPVSQRKKQDILSYINSL